MKFYKLISLFAVAGLLFILSCGTEEKKNELEKVESVDELIEHMDNQAEKIDAAPDSASITDNKDAATNVAPVEQLTEEKITAAPVSGDYLSKPFQGYIASLDALVTGSDGRVNKAKAQELHAKGNLIVLMGSDNQVYFVYNEDGTFAGKRLAGYANNQKVGLLGKAKVIDGINVFIMNLIESM